MSAEENKELIRRHTSAFNEKRLEVIDETVDINYVDHGPFKGQLPGREGMKQAHQYFYEGFPDIYQTIDDMVAEDDKIVVRWTCTGTHLGHFVSVPIAPTGKVASVRGIDIFRITDGKIAECWHVAENLQLLLQLGVLKPQLF